jgi:hypothetical protein
MRSGVQEEFLLDIFSLKDETATMACNISNKINPTAQKPRTAENATKA